MVGAKDPHQKDSLDLLFITHDLILSWRKTRGEEKKKQGRNKFYLKDYGLNSNIIRMSPSNAPNSLALHDIVIYLSSLLKRTRKAKK